MAWIGGVMSVLGLAGVLWCIRKAAWLRGAQVPDEQIKAELQKLIFAHMASIGLAFLGLGLLFTGLLLK